MRRFYTVLLFFLLALASPASASESRALLADLAEHQTHGWASIAEGIDYPELEAAIASGQRVYVPCGVVSILAKRRLDRAGIPNRLVGAFSHEAGVDLLDVPESTLESHAMLEVWEAGRWVLYDVDGNVRAVDESGQGVDFVTFAEERHYDRLTDPASDPDYDLTASPHPLYEAALFADHEAWYDRVLNGTLTILRGARYAFTGDELRDTLEGLGGYEWLPEERWLEVVGEAPAARSTPVIPPTPIPVPIPTPPVTAPPTPAPAPTPTAEPSAKRARCTLRGSPVKTRRVGCRQAKRVLRRFTQDGGSPQGWRCRGGRSVRCYGTAGQVAIVRVRVHP